MYADTTSSLLREFLESGRADVFAEVDRRYRPIVEGLARRAGFGDADADDIAQETLMRLSQHADRFDPERAKFKTWLLAIARRCLVDAGRALQKRRGWRGHSVIETIQQDSDVSNWWDRECEAEVFRRALAELRETSRTSARTLEAFERVSLKDEDPSRVARDIGMTVEQVYVAKSRCIVKLRPILERLRALYELD